MITGIIYCHKNKINNKVYIGSTIQKPNRRWRKRTISSYKSCPAFYRALNKYGWKNFETSILEDNILFEQISTREEYYINLYNSIAPNGYNTNKIVEGRVQFSKSTKEKISNKRKEYYSKLTEPIIAYNRKEHIIINNDEYKNCSKCKENKLLIEYRKDKNSWDNLLCYCKTCQALIRKPLKKLTPEQLKESYRQRTIKIRESIINNYKTKPEIKKKISKSHMKPIKAVHTETKEILIFQSALEAKNKGFNNSNISKALKSGKPYRNYIWSYI